MAEGLQQQVTAAIEAADSDSNATAATQALADLLQAKVTTRLLVDTQAGKKIRRLASHKDKDIAEAAAKVVAAWKDTVKQEQQHAPASGTSHLTANGSHEEAPTPKRQKSQGSKPDAVLSPQAPAHDPSVSTGPLKGAAVFSLDSRPSGSEAPSDSPSQAAPKPAGKLLRPSAPVHPAKTGDPVRDKARVLLAEALALAAEDVAGGDPCARAVEVEKAMLAQNGGANQKYKAKLRSLAFNLRDANNPDLRRRVLSAEVSGETLVNMQADELGSDARKGENDKIRAEALRESERGQHMQKATTDQFQCSKCRQRKCTYYQMQTRSADEPMTTFVTCVNCGKNWKF